MILERILDFNSTQYIQAFDLYLRAFPRDERRGEEEHNHILSKQTYHFDVLKEGEELLGIMLYWQTSSFIFLEHFAIMEGKRNLGLGGIALDLLKEKGQPIILEIEEPIDDITKRRAGFYSRNGFVITEHEHIQAKLKVGDKDLHLKLLSYPYAISKKEYWDFISFMSMEIGILPLINHDIEISALKEDDDWERVARQIYLSNTQGFSRFLTDIEDGVKFITTIIQFPTPYNKDNILVAKLDGVIVGVIVGRNFQMFDEEDASATIENNGFLRHGIISKEELSVIKEGYYISSLFVEPSFRCRGIAAALLQKAIDGKEFCYIECDKSNIFAWRICLRLGFTIVYEYQDDSNDYIYKMIRKAN